MSIFVFFDAIPIIEKTVLNTSNSIGLIICFRFFDFYPRNFAIKEIMSTRQIPSTLKVTKFGSETKVKQPARISADV